MRKTLLMLTMVPALLMPAMAIASEADFLRSLQGKWLGNGMVTMRLASSPIRVNCNFSSEVTGAALSMNGICRGLVVVARAVSADLRAAGGRYTGVYVGPAGGQSMLSGRRQGNAIHLSIRWNREVNGSRQADMLIQKTGDSGLKLQTTHLDPKTGQKVVTSDIRLSRQ